jgi:SAM-dependent methyltransferase
VLALQPDSADNHNTLGLVLNAAGRSDEAAVAFERALLLDPAKYGANHKRLGDLRRRQGRWDEAAAWYRRGLAVGPRNVRENVKEHVKEDAEAHAALGAVLGKLGQWDEAAAHCERALALQPELQTAYFNLATILVFAGKAEPALRVATQALLRQQTPTGQSLFLRALTSLQSSPELDDDMREFVVRALSEPWVRPNKVVSACLAIVRADRRIDQCIERAAAAWPTRLSAEQLFGPSGLAAACNDRVLTALLENALIVGVEMERLLTQARAIFLDAASEPDAAAVDSLGLDVLGRDLLGFCCAVARQCFINEYVFALTDAEARQVEALRRRLAAALDSGTEVPAQWLTVFAAYAPLHSLRQAERLLARPWPTAVDDLLTQQVREPIEQRRLRDTIPRLTPIEDVVSMQVRGQYEENPYPRWVKAAPVGEPCGIDAFLHAQFPHAAFRDLGKATGLDILVAGCGTGQVSIEYARKLGGNGHVLAIDLSLTSLCYAKSKSQSLGLGDIEYGQADILALGSVGRAFDLINASGVLHHLADPFAGWRVLLSCLRPNGFICVGLYSEIARRPVVAAREHIARCGYGDRADDIRRCRQDILAAGAPLADVAELNDFFGLSNCRDLLFHVQEHRFTLPEIKSFLAENGLDLIGFNLPPQALRGYGSRFPDDRAMADLDNWHAFELDNPDTFIGMYQLWAQKRAPDR